MSFYSQKLIILERVDSTNNYAMALVQKGAANNGDAVFAMEQENGRGRRGKKWESRRGENIVLSIMVQMQWLPVQRQFHLSIAVALGCRDFFLKYIKENIKIKWPNDIIINDSKAGGILIENGLKGNLWQWAIIGIGLNINQEQFNTGNIQPTSLKKITGKDYDVVALSGELQGKVLDRIEHLASGEFSNFLDEYNQNLYCRHQMVRIKKGELVYETRIREISAAGELITVDTRERRFIFDEVTWLGQC